MANTAANADGLYLGARVSYSLSFDNHDVFDPRRIRCLGLGLKVADVKSTFLPPSPSFYFMRSCMGIYFYRRLVRWVSTFCQIPGEVLARRGMFWRGPLIKTKASPAVVKWDSPPARDLFLHTVCARLVWLAGLADGFSGGWGVTLSSVTLIKTKASLAVVKPDSPPAEASIFTNGLCGMFRSRAV